MTYYIKQAVFSWRDRFSICDARGEACFTAESELLTWAKKLHLYDASGREAACLRQRLWSWLYRYDVWIGAEHAAVVVKDFSLFRPHYRIEGPDWEIDGSFWEHDYSITCAGRPIVTIHKEWLTWGDCYVIEIADGENDVLALAVVLAIDCITAAQASSAS